MPRTIDQGFDALHVRIKPNRVVTEAATKHRASIKSSIEKIYSLDYFFQSGSSGNSTDVYPYSDVDYMAIIPTNQLKVNSTTMLTKVRTQLDSSFPRTGVHISTPAVVVPFGLNGSETTEVVPGDLRKFEKGYAVFEIADGEGGWLRSAPKAHNEYVTRVNQEHGYNVKTLVRFVKAWKYYNNVSISSFYLEMRVAKYVDSHIDKNKPVVFIVHLHYFFKYLQTANLANLTDPTGIVGYINGCSTEIKRQNAMKSLNLAVSRSENAMNEQLKLNTASAFLWLDKLFNGRFPGYYF